MYLKKLDLQGVRNLVAVQLSFAPRVNLFYGHNGSGKTSVLEAIYLLGRGRSFRTRNPLSVMAKDQDGFISVGYLSKGSGATTPVGVQRLRNGGFVMRVAGEPVYAASHLADAVPLLLLNSDSFSLLEGGPGGRRRYLDWGVFHVEQGYRDIWKRFQRSLKQRNSLLRRDRIDGALLATWDREFVSLAEQVDSYRKGYAERLIPLIKKAASDLGGKAMADTVSFGYYPGWDTAQSLESVLLSNRPRDQQNKVTHHGPHRADLRVRSGRAGAAELLSRGQAKVLVSAMQLAQGQLFKEITGQQCIYLLDDLPAELDEERRKAVGRLLMDLEAQVFVTGVDKEDLLMIWPEIKAGDIGLFHVEHGRVMPAEVYI
ncbi:MAG: DNA replication/repair protein RecF [Porticoccaceae bacterium]|nr:DNA replication/repair protein RecF [Pseudomonadales bacterium]MCP5172914.1 DNA replication/repair protein RecF [Pseudomonadales bacterium]MCP5302388.1 DNA replication/repair protein RecF [Pseudomonadales bacterium]